MGVSVGFGYVPVPEIKTRLGVALREIITSVYVAYSDDPGTAEIEKVKVVNLNVQFINEKQITPRTQVKETLAIGLSYTLLQKRWRIFEGCQRCVPKRDLKSLPTNLHESSRRVVQDGPVSVISADSRRLVGNLILGTYLRYF